MRGHVRNLSGSVRLGLVLGRARTMLGFAALLPLAWTAPAPPRRYIVQPGSRFWIEGSSTVGRYTCRARRVDGEATVSSEAPLTGQAVLSAEVRSFDCGQPQMNRDLARALRADRQPRVLLTVERVDVGESTRGNMPVSAEGTLRLAGVERPVAFRASAQTLANGQVRITGQYVLRMSDFDVTPPSGMLGLVRAHDRVLARFDVVAAAGR